LNNKCEAKFYCILCSDKNLTFLSLKQVPYRKLLLIYHLK